MVNEIILIPTQTCHKVNLSMRTVFVGRSLSVRICGGLATGRASWGRIFRLTRGRQFLAGTGIVQESGGIRRNPEESSGNTGIPIPQEFLQKNPVKVAENRNFQDPSKTTFP
jgi:hypothetical protein